MSNKKLLLLLFILTIPFANFSFAEDVSFDEGGKYEEGEEDSIFTYGAEISFASQYIWRGIELSDGIVLQPDAWISAYGFTFEVWGNYVLNNEPNQWEFNEIDLIPYYEYEWNNLTLQTGFEIFFYPNVDDEPSTVEFTAGLSYSIFENFNIFTKHYFDIGEYNGAYYGTAGIGYQGEPEIVPFYIDSSIKLGWANSEFNEVNLEVSESALNVIIADLSIYYYPLDYLYLRPHIQFSSLLDDSLRDAADSPTIVSGGIAVGVEY